MKKKIIITLGSIFSLLLIGLFVVPYFFKDEIKDEIIRYVNKNFDGEVQIDDYNLSLVSNFPKFTFQFYGIKIDDIDKNRIVDIKSISAEIDSKNLLIDNSITIESIDVIQPKINYILKSDSASTELTTTEIEQIGDLSESTTEETSTNRKKLSFNISRYEIVNASIIINDENNSEFVNITNLNHNGFGIFENDILSLNTATFIDDINVSMDGINYLKNSQIKGEFNLDLDIQKKIYALKENSLSINGIELNWIGIIKEVKNSFDIDLRFNTPDTKFKDLLDIIPEQLKKDLDKVETDGNFNIEGSIIGLYNEKTLPGLDIKANITNAYLKYPDLSESLNNINLLLKINKPQGNDLDKVSVEIPSISIKIADNSFRGSFYTNNLITDPNISGKILANIDLTNIRKAIPLEKDDDINGKIFTDISLKGKLSDLENENYENFEAKGDISLNDFNFSTKSLKNKIFIQNANLKITPEFLYLEKFNFTLGSSDINAKGKISKYLEYFLKNKQLTGWLDIKSNNFNAVDFIPQDNNVKSEKTETPSTTTNTNNISKEKAFEMEVISIPKNIVFDNNISISQFRYGNIIVRNLKGHLGIKNQNAYLQKVNMEIFDGNIFMGGNYSSKDSIKPVVNFDINLNKVDIQKLSKTFVFVKEIAPIAKSASGKISAKMDLKTTLNNKMNPVYETMFSKGKITTNGLNLKNTDFLKDLGNVLNVEELRKNPKVEDINLSYTIIKGILSISPFKLKIAEIESKIEGSSDIGKQTVDMDIAMVFPRKYLSSDTNEIIDNAVNLANNFGAKVSIGKTIDVNAKVDGNITSPNYSLTYGPDKARTPEEYLKNEADRLIENAKKDVGKNLEKKAKDFLNDLFK